MARRRVPPPPEFDELDFMFQQTPSQSQSQRKFQGEFAPSSFPHAAEHILAPSTSGLPSYERIWNEQVPVQRVPETPSLWQTQHTNEPPSTVECRLNCSFDTGSGREKIGLRSVNEVPEHYHGVFKNFSHFNYVQSKVFDDVMYTDSSLVTSAPTGSGKTVIFELAIVRLLMHKSGNLAAGKIIYVAPIKALCSERFKDWQAKFEPLGLRCCELTGDSQLDDYFELQNAQIVMTTPEKWDSMTRKWRDYKSLVQLVGLFLIDEVHQLNDETRGPTMEAIVSRMKTIQASMTWDEGGGGGAKNKLRFIAVSATIPNISDVAAWLGNDQVPALEYSIDESHRPVRLRRVVLGYSDASTEFKFDLSLNYRLGSVIQLYSEQKPTLVFCATRKGTQQAAGVLVKEARFVMNTMHKQRLHQVANSLRDSKLRELVLFGVGYHHAGLDTADRKAIELMFTAGDLPVLFATSTLAMGVNLPAHLVVIKSTMHYIAGMFQECSESQILQMIGRAGRPQFDTTATAVIMTRNSTKAKYEALLSGNQLIESSLHHNLIEHLNAEVVLHTITDVSIALEWLRSTFFYIRVKQNPKHYGMPVDDKEMEEKLQQLCLKNLQMLEACSLVKMSEGFILQHTELGRLMARYCVAFESMKRFLGFKGKETLAELVQELSQCKEFQDVRLRVNEKRVLNTLNKDKVKPTIRFQMTGKVKSTDMKVNCLIQATLGCLAVQEFALYQDTQKIFRAASRLSKCLLEVQIIGDNFQSLFGAVILHKCIQAKLWENSRFISKQLDKIGLSLSTTLVNAGLSSFEKLQNTSPRELELIMNKHPPFGNQIRDAVALLPRYKLSLNQVIQSVGANGSELEVTVFLLNHSVLKEKGLTWGSDHTCMLLIGDADNVVLCKQKISDTQLLNRGMYTRKLVVQRAKAGDELKGHYISLTRVGMDVNAVFTPKYTTASATQRPTKKPAVSSGVATPSAGTKGGNDGVYFKPCNHKCLNKSCCGHECCKHGIAVKTRASLKLKPTSAASTPTKQRPAPRPAPHQPTPQSRKPSSTTMNHYVDQLRTRATDLPPAPALNRIKPTLSVHNYPRSQQKGSLQTRFTYAPRPSMKLDDVHEGLPPPVPSHTSAADAAADAVELSRTEGDEEFWSAFCESSAAASKQPTAELDEFRSDRFEQEDFFSDECVVEDSHEMCGAFLHDKTARSKGHLPTDSKSKRPCVQTSSRFPLQYYSALEDGAGVEERAGSICHDFEKQQQQPVFLKKRKRMIDEIYGVESESYASASITRPSSPSNSTVGSVTAEIGSPKYASSFHKAGVQNTKASSKRPWHTRMSSSGYNAPLKANFPPVAEYSKENIPPLQKSLPSSVSHYSAGPQAKATLPRASNHASSYSIRSPLKTNLHLTSSYGHQSVRSPLTANLPPTSSYSRHHGRTDSLPTSSGSCQHSPLKANFPPGTALPAQGQFGSWGEPRLEPSDVSRPSDVCWQRSIPEQALKHIPCAPPVPAACSFFTAGTVDMEDESDVFGSVFAGIF